MVSGQQRKVGHFDGSDAALQFVNARDLARLAGRVALVTGGAGGMGGAVVFVASRNGLAASPDASASCTARASEIHLARCLALEGAEAGIRVHLVNPDAELRGPKMWSGDWLDQRAATHGTDKGGLEEMYRQRSMIERSVLPEEIAEVVDGNLACIALGQQIGSMALTIWVGDGSNCPGQVHVGRQFERYLDATAQVHAGLRTAWRLFTEHRMYAPALYSTVVQDWGTTLMIAQALGAAGLLLREPRPPRA